MTRRRARAWTFCALLGITGCGGTADPLADYVARVARVLERPAPALDRHIPSSWPRARELQRDVVAESTGLVGFLRLHRCDLGALVGERNGPIGRTATGMERLAYEIDLLATLDWCVRRPAVVADPGFRAELLALAARKRVALDDVLVNGVLASGELAAHASGGSWPDPAADDETNVARANEAARALRALARLVAQPREQAVDPARRALRLLGRQSVAAGLERRMVRTVDALDAVSAMLEDVTSTRALCRNGRPTPKSRVLHTVLVERYAQRVQPGITRDDRAARAWVPAWEALRAAFGTRMPAALEAWHGRLWGAHAHALAARHRQAVTRHQAAWQRVLDQCGLAIGVARSSQ